MRIGWEAAIRIEQAYGSGDMTASRKRKTEESAPAKGRPPRIDRDKIIEAARALPPEKVTMQAVAQILQVDPTALNYHVGGRRDFLRLVALDRARLAARAFVEGEAPVNWEAALRRFALAMRASIASIGPLAPHLEFDSSSALAFIEPVERVLRILVDEGLGLGDAVRALSLVAHTAAHAGRADAMRRSGEDPHGARSFSEGPGSRLFGVLGEVPGAFPLLEELAGGKVEGLGIAEGGDADAQFTFELETVLAGIAARVAASREG